ncbi:MAG: AI-2E family transporter [Verrucomicrobia bacterium]|nr:AI-2E family transporter [Verrucomicrobiota bacterium]
MYPTPWQRKTLWNAITAISLLVIAAIFVFVIYVATQVIAFLQPLLLPVAFSGVLAYLLEPVVSWLARRGLPRILAVAIVFGAFVLSAGSLMIGVIPSVYTESVKFSAALPGYIERGWGSFDSLPERNVETLSKLSPGVFPTPEISDDRASRPNEDRSKTSFERFRDNPFVQQWLQYSRDQLPALVQRTWNFAQTSLTGVFGVFGFITGLLMVPIYVFFFLKESPRIAESWSSYLPVRKSNFKDELVAVLTEINGYLINFFRGQLLVACFDATLIGIGLAILGLQFAFLIGLSFAVFGLIPYLGYVICYIPAVLIAFVQFNDWIHPLWVTIIFFLIVAQVDGLVLTPRIVGNSVGLHPMTIIVSVILWTLVLGGPLGAILAIPLTATLKVLLRRYIWDRQRNIFFRDEIAEKREIEIAT